MARTPELTWNECKICGLRTRKVTDCTCANGWHYVDGSLITLSVPFENPNYGQKDFLGEDDHQLSWSRVVHVCWRCQEQILALIDDGALSDLIWADDSEDDAWLDSESRDAWQKGWDECADHFEELLTQPSFLRTPNAVDALLEDQESEQKLYASITGDVPCPWCDGHLVTEYLQNEIYLVKCSNRCGRTTIVHACSPAEAVHTVTLPTPSREVVR